MSKTLESRFLRLEQNGQEKIMPVQLQVSQTIDRPVGMVFDFVAREHVQNHPRWDPDMELAQITEGPLGVGTLIRRRSSRGGKIVEGTMEVEEFEPDHAMATAIHDGATEMRARMTFEAAGEDQTIVTTAVELPDIDDSVDTTFLESMIARSLRNMKQLIETER